jgi:DNA primase
MKIPVEFYELLRNKINISDVVRQKITLTRKSGEYLGLCPFHIEKTPSFTVNDTKKFYHCFGCGAHGDVIKFISNANGMSYKESAIKLAQDYAIELPKLSKEQEVLYEETDQVLNVLKMATEFFQSQLTQESLNYLTTRGINQKAIEEFAIGFAPKGGKLQKFFEAKSVPLMRLAKAGLVGKKEDGRIYEIFHDRIIFPIRNIYNKTIAFGGRVIGNALPKYLNSPETIVFKKNETLYGENKAISAAYKKNYSILVEGYLDVISLHNAGFEEAVASLGTAVTEGHIQKLWRAGDEIIICLDGDSAGVKASSKVINIVLPLVAHDKKISFIQLPNKSDPDDIIKNKGPDFFKQLIETRNSLSEMIWNIEYDGKLLITPEARANLEVNLENYSKQINDRVLSNNYYRFFKDQIWQNLINKRSTKVNINKGSTIPVVPKHDYSEIEMLEYALCSMLVRFPEITQKEDIRNFLLTVDFKNPNLTDFRDWFFTAIVTDNICEIETIEEMVEKTRFYNIFLLLLNIENLFLDISFSKKVTNHNLLWEWLYKKYYLALLKQEYTSIIQNGSDEGFKKAILYQKEILKTSQELQDLNESFIINY